MTFGSLFAGIGGMDLGLERSGMQCKWQVEIDPFCQRVLSKHWPHVRRHNDVRTFPPVISDIQHWYVDLICGGFPCQDVSAAGKKIGINGDRSGLWSEYLRVVRYLQPKFVLIENVYGLIHRGINRVISDLDAIGYDAEWDCFSAAEFGAPHLRQRLFILAYSREERSWADSRFARGTSQAENPKQDTRSREWPGLWEPRVGYDAIVRLLPLDFDGRADDGIPDRLDRIAALGNAVVPQIAEHIGKMIMSITQKGV